MGQSHSSEVTQHNQSKRRSFLITPKKLIKLRKQTSHENSGTSQHANNTQNQVVGEKDYHKTADRHGMYKVIVQVSIKTKQHAYHFLLLFTLYNHNKQLFRSMHLLVVLTSIMVV